MRSSKSCDSAPPASAVTSATARSRSSGWMNSVYGTARSASSDQPNVRSHAGLARLMYPSKPAVTSGSSDRSKNSS